MPAVYGSPCNVAQHIVQQWFGGRILLFMSPRLALPTEVLGVAEVRRRLPAIARNFRDHVDTGFVYFGSYNRPDAAIVPIELLELLASFIEDAEIAERVQACTAVDTGVRHVPSDVAASLGIDHGGAVVERHLGTPQGGPLSPLLANVLLDRSEERR